MCYIIYRYYVKQYIYEQNWSMIAVVNGCSKQMYWDTVSIHIEKGFMHQ